MPQAPGSRAPMRNPWPREKRSFPAIADIAGPCPHLPACQRRSAACTNPATNGLYAACPPRWTLDDHFGSRSPSTRGGTVGHALVLAWNRGKRHVQMRCCSRLDLAWYMSLRSSMAAAAGSEPGRWRERSAVAPFLSFIYTRTSALLFPPGADFFRLI
jgi:hypothetical protein